MIERKCGSSDGRESVRISGKGMGVRGDVQLCKLPSGIRLSAVGGGLCGVWKGHFEFGEARLEQASRQPCHEILVSNLSLNSGSHCSIAEVALVDEIDNSAC